MEGGQRQHLERLQALAEDDDFHAGDPPEFPNTVDIASVLAGSERIELSHAGGEMGSLEEGIEEDWVDENAGTKTALVRFFLGLRILLRK
jgi:hypothetical protein